MRIPNPKLYIEEHNKWVQAGQPMRSEERIKEIYNEHCRPCENIIKLGENNGQCKVCTCFLREKGDDFNKIAWATTRCPLEEPKWVEEPTNEAELVESPIEETPQVQHIGRVKKVRDCGCG